MCSKAADLLSQKQNEGIESDYERDTEKCLSNGNHPNTSGTNFIQERNKYQF